LWSGIAAGLLWVGTASAEPTPADRATARELASEGYWALQDKRYADAADRFRRADTLVHAPTLTLDWARSLVGLGQFVEAQERYELIIREGVDPKAPPSWKRAMHNAKAELAALKPRLAWVTITVKGSNDAQVTIDGYAVPAAAIGVRRAVNPGSRDVAVGAKGFLGQHQKLSLAEGGEGTAFFQLVPDPDQQAQPVLVVPKVAVVEPEPPPRRRSRAPIYAALGVAGAGFIVGGVTGVLFLNKRSELQKQCDPDPDNCPEGSADGVQAYDTLGTVSGVGFVVGGAALVTGITLWLLDSKSGATPARGMVVRPYLGVGTIGAVGSF